MPDRRVQHGVAWLTDLKKVSPALGGAAETASPGVARNSTHRAVAGKLLGLSVAKLKGRRGRRAIPVTSPVIAALSADRRFRPTSNPRSSILDDPVARRIPEMPSECPQPASKRAFWPRNYPTTSEANSNPAEQCWQVMWTLMSSRGTLVFPPHC